MDSRSKKQLERLNQLLADDDFGMSIYRRARPLKAKIKNIWFPLDRVVKARREIEADSENLEEEKRTFVTTWRSPDRRSDGCRMN